MVERCSLDFGRVRRARPRAVVQASDEAGAASALRICRDAGLPLVLRGAGGSCGGHVLHADAVVLWNLAARPECRLLDGDRVEVSGRTTWSDLCRFLSAHGREPTVLTDYLELTVGGTLSVGGYGLRSVVHGAQLASVERLRLRLPDGSAREVGPKDALFRYALGGRGQVGLIASATLRTLPRRPVARLFTSRHTDLESLAGWLEWLEPIPRVPLVFNAFASGGAVFAEVGVEASGEAGLRSIEPPVDTPASVRNVRFLHTVLQGQRLRWLDQHRGRRRLWTDFVLPRVEFVVFARFLDRLRAEPALRDVLAAIYVLAMRPESLPLAPSAQPGRLLLGAGLYCMVKGGDDAGLRAARGALGRCLERCVELGGRPYRYGWNEVADERAIYGRALDPLRDLRRELDPQGLFQPQIGW